MDINRFTEKLQQAIRAAESAATRYGHQQIDVEHLLAALLEQPGGLAPSILQKSDVNLETLGTRLEAELDRMPKVSGPRGHSRQIYVTPRFSKLLERAEEEARQLKDEYISVEHVLLAAHRGPRRRRPPAEGTGSDARAADAGAARSARQPAGDLAESGGHLRSAGTLRPRSDPLAHRASWTR